MDSKNSQRTPQQPAQPQYANYWAPLTCKRHILPHSAQPQHTNHWALRTRKRHQQEHQPQRPTESSDPTQHAKGRTGDCPGPRKETATRRNVTQGGGTCPVHSPAESRTLDPNHKRLWLGCFKNLLGCGGSGQAGLAVRPSIILGPVAPLLQEWHWKSRERHGLSGQLRAHTAGEDCEYQQSRKFGRRSHMRRVRDYRRDPVFSLPHRTQRRLCGIRSSGDYVQHGNRRCTASCKGSSLRGGPVSPAFLSPGLHQIWPPHVA